MKHQFMRTLVGMTVLLLTGLAAADELFADLQQALRLVVGTSGLAPEALSASATGFVLDCCESPDATDLRARVTAHRERTESLFDRLMPPPSP